MEATTEVHQWILVFFSLVFVGLLVSSNVYRKRIKRRDKQLIDLRIEKDHLEREINYLIKIRWYIQPVVVDVDTLKDISWQELVRQGVTTSTHPDAEVGAAIRVMKKVEADRSIYGKKRTLFLNPAALQASSKNHKRHLTAIDGALGKKQQTA